MPAHRWSAPWLLVVLLVIWAGCGSSPDDGASQGPGPRGSEAGEGASTPTVEAVEARFGALPLEERMSGTVRAVNQVSIYPEIDAPVVAVEAQTGDYVRRGEPLVRLRADTYRERLRQAEANLQIAEAEMKSARATLAELQAQLKRTERLAEKQFQSEQELEALRARVQSAEAGVEQAVGRIAQMQATVDERAADLRRTVVRAPFSGYVGNRDAEVGQRVSGSTRLYTMGSLDTVRVEIAVTDKMFGKVRPGQTAQITAPTLGDTVITASVTRMSPFLNDESYSAEVEIDIPNPDGALTPGMFVEVNVLYGESEQATLVPVSALYENPDTGVQGVFVAPTLGEEIPVQAPDSFDQENPPPLTQPTPTTFREVEVLAEGREAAGIRGVEPGTWIVTVGQNLLSAGDDRTQARVRPMPWPRIYALQRLQDRDLLRNFMARQQRLAKQRFGDPDSSSGDSVRPAAAREDASARRPADSTSTAAPTRNASSSG